MKCKKFKKRKQEQTGSFLNFKIDNVLLLPRLKVVFALSWNLSANFTPPTDVSKLEAVAVVLDSSFSDPLPSSNPSIIRIINCFIT